MAKTANPCLGAAIEKKGYPCTVKAVRFPFVPSTQQLLAYAAAQGHRTYKNHKTGNPTMDGDAIERLIKKYPEDRLYPLLADYTEAQRIEGTYIDGKGMSLADDGRVHPIFTHNPSTFRLAAENPPMHQIPTTYDQESLYRHVRNIFVAGEGMLLGARDFSGIEAKLVGYLARDKDYLRLCGLGIHDFILANLLKREVNLTWSDADVKLALQDAKAFAAKTFGGRKRDGCKKMVHSGNYLATPFAIYTNNKHIFENLKECEELYRFYFELFPLIAQWQTGTLEEAERLGYLRCPDGFIHRFWKIYDYEKVEGKWEKKLGPDAKRAVAFRPQHGALTYMAEALLALAETPAMPWLRLTIHDEIFWECPPKEMDAVDETVKAAMEMPNRYFPLDPAWTLGTHLVVATEGKRGERWGSMH